jgi:Fur family ferric uptake transcriptional regulator
LTRAAFSQALTAGTADEAVVLLRRHGLRITAARRLVLEALYAAEAPLSAEQIAEGVAGRVPRSDLASVYRNLETLEQVGLVRHVHLGHAPGMYALSGPAREYLVCESCSGVRTLEAGELAEVKRLIRDSFGWRARFTHFPIVGLCPDCLAEGHDHEEQRPAHP